MLLALLLALAAQDPAPAQDPPLQDGPQKDPAVQEPAPPSGFEATLAILPRLSRLTGTVEKNFNLKYDKLWAEGFGLATELDFSGAVGRNWSLGGYVSLGADYLPGELHSESGSTYDMEPLTLGRFMTGFKARLRPDGGFYFDGRAGLGMAYFMEAEDKNAAPSPATLESSAVFAVEFAAHIGYSTGNLLLAIGFAIQQQEAPNGPFVNPDEGGVVTSLEIEIGFRF